LPAPATPKRRGIKENPAGARTRAPGQDVSVAKQGVSRVADCSTAAVGSSNRQTAIDSAHRYDVRRLFSRLRWSRRRTGLPWDAGSGIRGAALSKRYGDVAERLKAAVC